MTLNGIVCSTINKPTDDKNHTLMFEISRLQQFQSHYLIALVIGAMSVLFCNHSAFADTYYSSSNNSSSNYSSNNSPLNFSLSFSVTDLNLDSGNVSYSIEQSRISALLVDRVSDNLNIGLIVGSNFSSLNYDAATAGISLNGNHIGFSINQTFGNNLQPGLHAYYIYQQANGENTLRTASLTWHEWFAEATLRVHLSNHWAIIAGGGVINLKADRRVSGDINETVRMNLDNNFQGKIAIELHTAPDDQIRLTVNRGAFDSSQLSFSHAF